MKIIVMSDSHGIYSSVRKVMKLQHDADLYVFLGDGEHDLKTFLLLHPEYEEKFLILRGNCDHKELFPQGREVLAYALPHGHKLLAAHGHTFQVNYGTERMVKAARGCHADIVLYGHTHIRDERCEDGIYILNPGSMGLPRDGKKQSYGVISISEKGILTNIVDVPLYD